MAARLGRLMGAPLHPLLVCTRRLGRLAALALGAMALGLAGCYEPEGTSFLSQAEMKAGLKEMLAVGIDSADARLSRRDAMLGNAGYRLANPETITPEREAVMRNLSYGDSLLNLLNTQLNRSAETAAPAAAAQLRLALADLLIVDGPAVLYADDTAATRYFKERTLNQAALALVPQVQLVVDTLAAAATYDSLQALYDGADQGDLLPQADLAGLVSYGLCLAAYQEVADQERRLRLNPGQRPTPTLQSLLARADARR